MTPRLLFIVPALNEEANVGNVVHELLAAFPDADVVVVDDGSSDRTATAAASAGALVLRLPTNLGIGAAVQTGLLFADRHDYDIAVQFDADGQHRADQVPALIAPLIEDRCDAVIGSRFLLREGRYNASVPRRIGNAILNTTNALLLRKRFTDSTSGFRAYNHRATAFLAGSYAHDYPEPEAIVALERHRFRVEEVGILMRSREAGRSSITLIRSVYYMFKVLLAMLVHASRPKRKGQHESTDPNHLHHRQRGGGGIRFRADTTP